MPKAPPLLPEEVLRRVLRVAQLDGTSVLFVAGGFALVSASMHDVVGALIGILIAGAGALELHGGSLLRRGDETGLRWLVNSQVFLLTAIMTYVSYRLNHPDPLVLSTLRAGVTEEQRQTLQQLGYTEDFFLLSSYRLMLTVFAFVSLLYQGGLAIYYFRRREPIARALDEGIAEE